MATTTAETTEPLMGNDIRHRLPEYKRYLNEVKKDPDGYDILVAHGSNSGSLYGFALEGGLVPTGWMIEGKSKAVPFTGSLKTI